MKLETARIILQAAQDKARAENMKPLAIAVLDTRGAVRAFIAEDGTSLHRGDVAIGKAYGAISLGIPSRSIGERAEKQAYFVAAISHITGGKMVPVAGGVLIRDADGNVAGAVGVTGDSSDNDETCAVAGIEAAGLTPQV